MKEDPLCRRAVRLLLDDLEKPAMVHVDAVCALMEDRSGSKEVQLPGVTVVREYDTLYIGREKTAPAPQMLTVQAGGCGCVTWGGYEIAWEDTYGELTVRSRRMGDAIRLPGGRKSLKKLLIDKKVPKEKRDTLPVVLLDGALTAVGGVVCIDKHIKIKERET